MYSRKSLTVLRPLRTYWLTNGSCVGYTRVHVAWKSIEGNAGFRRRWNRGNDGRPTLSSRPKDMAGGVCLAFQKCSEVNQRGKTGWTVAAVERSRVARFGTTQSSFSRCCWFVCATKPPY